ncbi:MAG: hypothetical protein AB3N24_05950 [Leisingera sp.]
MRILGFSALAAVAITATPALAGGPPIVQFNGYSVTIEAGKASGLDPTKVVTSKAEQACSSVGKSARLEEERQIRPMRFQYFFICL